MIETVQSLEAAQAARATPTTELRQWREVEMPRVIQRLRAARARRGGVRGS